MKKYVVKLMGLVVTMSLMVGCASNEVEEVIIDSVTTEEVTIEKMKIVTTMFPEYDWLREMMGENLEQVELSMLLDDGVDLHSYQMTTDDMIEIAESDLFIYVGGVSDAWVDDALQNASNPDMRVLNLMEVLGDAVKNEETVEGMQDSSHDHDHEHEDHEHDEHDHDHEDHNHDDHDHDEVHEHDHGDEHIWLSLKNAEIICEAILEELIAMDIEHADLYTANAEAYIERIQALDKEYEETVGNTTFNTILVADRFPFRYLVDDYEIEYYAAFSGCSAETEASFETISFLANKLDELELTTVFTTESSDNKIPETIIANTSDKTQEIKVLNAIQSITANDIASGVTYLSIMEENLAILREALK